MPRRTLKVCAWPGCGEPTRERHCAAHAAQAKQQAARREQARGTAAHRGYGSRWQKARTGFLLRHPLCAECERHGRVSAATVVDHIDPHRGDQHKFWDRDNWQPLCKPCHDRKTAGGG